MKSEQFYRIPRSVEPYFTRGRETTKVVFYLARYYARSPGKQATKKGPER